MTARTRLHAIRLLVLRSVVLVVLTGAVFLLLTSAGSADQPPPPTSEYVVASEDTLWEIAAGVSAPGDDVRMVVAEIQELNGLSGGTIHPGQVLDLPLR